MAATKERKVMVGDRFVGGRGDDHFVLEAVTLEDSDKIAFEIVEPGNWDCPENTPGRIGEGLFKSMSTAAAATVTPRPNSINGWSYWHPEGEEPEVKPRGRAPKAKKGKSNGDTVAVVEEDEEA